MREASVVCSELKCELGEGCLWDEVGQRLYFVDIVGNTVLEWDPSGGALRRWATPTNVGTVVMRSRARGGGLVVALKEDIAHLDPDSGQITTLAHVLDNSPPQLRFNDGKCDPAGRFWVGSMDFKDHRGHLYRMDADGTVQEMFGEVTCSNGIVWTGDRRTMYYIDTPTGRVDAFDYDDATGAIGNRRPAVRVDPALGHPDGMAIDAEDRLWVALWGGGAVARFDPRTGALLEKIACPGAKNVTSCAFGGPELRDLYITTAGIGMKPEETAEYPAAGRLFHVRMDGVRGVAAPAFVG